MRFYSLTALLTHAPSGLYRLKGNPRNPRIDALCRLKGVRLFRVDTRGARSKRVFLSACARTMSFPSWFGANWDALADCLGDLEWAPAVAYLVLLQDVGCFAAESPLQFHRALAVFEDAARRWSRRGTPFRVLVAGDRDGGPLPVVAAA